MLQQLDDTAYLTPDFINSLEVVSFSGKIHNIDSDNKLKNLEIGCSDILGFDTETRPSFKKNISNKISIIQLSDENNAYIFYLKRLSNKDKIIQIFNNENITKVGSGIKDDLRKIRESFGSSVEPKSFVDIQQMVKSFNLKKFNLRFLTALFLNKRIIKSSQTSNWERYPLTEKQQIYAATDAWICLKIYKEIKKVFPD
ncbi:MAG: 3'-5' exonuclease domain-containing protein 2 [Calditerrivibrio sp.]|nr:3'-5' exonuclease domain-containing protein 2 [Calditerrivibrio sp.]